MHQHGLHPMRGIFLSYKNACSTDPLMFQMFRLWQKYRRPVTLAHEYSVNAVSFSGVEPYPFAIAVSTKVILYEANRSKPIKVFLATGPNT